MLQSIREKLQGWVAGAVLALIAVPLVLTFSASDFGVSGSSFAARVDGEEIPSIEFQRVYQNRLIAEQESSGQVAPGIERQLKEQTLEELVLNRAVTRYVRDAGYRVSNARVADYIRNLPVFQVGGQFSKPAYDATLVTQGLSPIAFENEQRAVLAVRQLQQGLVESSFFTPDELRRLIALDQERREAAYVLLDPRQLGASPISDADIQAYYAANPTQFQTPETVDLEYVELSLSELEAAIKPDEASLRAAYDADPTRFRTAEERRGRHILVVVDASRGDADARVRADEVARQLAAGGDFALLAAEYSDDPGSAGRGGDLGFAGRGTYVDAFEEALFSLQTGEVSPPVKTEFGYHLVELQEVRAGSERTFAEARGQLVEELRQNEAQEQFFLLAERLDDLALENPDSLEPAVAETGLLLRRYTGFSRTGGGPFGSNQALVSAVFSNPVLEGGENTPLIEIDERRAVVARAVAHNRPAARPLAEVREEVEERLRALRGMNEATTRGTALLARLQADDDLVVALQEAGLKAVESGSVMRRSPTLPAELLAAIFRAPKPTEGAITPQGLNLSDGSYAVFWLKSVVPGEPGSVPRELRDERKRLLAESAAIAEVEALALQLRESAKVVVSPTLFEADEEI